MKKQLVKKSITIISIIWLIFSFILPYYLITNKFLGWMFFSSSFIKYLLFILPISILAIAYIITKGEFSEFSSKIKPIIASTVILIVLAFTTIQWTTVTTTYCHYGSYCKNAVDRELQFLLPAADTDFENATIYREALKNKYDIMFNKIWTFGLIMFGSTFLLLYASKKKQ